jgi:hypothetical protein
MSGVNPPEAWQHGETPVGDYLHARFGDRPDATHWMGGGGDPGCCAGPHALCTYRAGWREALVSLAAELERLGDEADAEAARGFDFTGPHAGPTGSRARQLR